MMIGLGIAPVMPSLPDLPIVAKEVDGRKLVVFSPDFAAKTKEALANNYASAEKSIQVKLGSESYTLRGANLDEKSGTPALTWVNSILGSGKGLAALPDTANCTGSSDCRKLAYAVDLDEAAALCAAGGIVILEPDHWSTGLSTGAMVAIGVGVVAVVGGIWYYSKRK